MILAPMVRGRRGTHREAFEAIQKAGFVRVRVDGAVYPLEEVPPLVPQKMHDIEAVVDRVVIRDGIDARLAESVRLAIKHGDGVVLAVYQTPDAKAESTDGNGWQEKLLNTRYACPKCGASIGEIEPRTFSFNSPYGACPQCHGLGVVDLPQANGDAANGIPLVDFEDAEQCPACGGSRLRPEARAARLGGKAIHEITSLSVAAATDFFRGLVFDVQRQPIARPIVAEIVRRLEFLLRVGTDYLTLDRPADTLSGGERQRVRLATGIGSGLVGVLYLLDEPSVGLHPRDNQRLIAALRDLERQGNTVVVVEHDEALMRESDYLIDMGPGAGGRGGTVVAHGTPSAVAELPASLTGGYLSGRESIPVPTDRRKPAKTRVLQLAGASSHNLQNIDVEIPLGLFVCVTGVSGSGKSSLVVDTLARALARKLNGAEALAAAHQGLRGAAQLDRLVEVDQSPIGRTPRSNAATYTGVWDEIRAVFSHTKQARQRGYGIGRFSFNTKGGRCETCEGQGVRRIAMNFLPDLEVTCPVCHGAAV